MAQSQNQAVSLAIEAKTMLNSAKSKDDYQRAAQKYEEALKIFQKVKSDKGAALCFNDLGGIQFRLGQWQKSLEYFEKSLAVCKKIGDVKGEGENFNNIGTIYYRLGQYNRALEYYEQSLAIRKNIGDVIGEAANVHNIGMIYDGLGQYNKALNFYEQSLAIFKKIGDVRKEGSNLNNIALVYQILGQYTKALTYFEQSLAIFKKIGDVRDQGINLSNIGMIYDGLGQYTKALAHFEQSLAISKKIGDVNVEGYNLNNIGAVYGQLGQHNKALDYYEQSLAIRKKIGDVKGEAGNLSNIGCVYKSLGQYTKALNYYEQSLAILKKIGDVNGEAGTVNNIGSVYSSLGQYTKALTHFEQSVTILKKIGDVHGEGEALLHIGWVYRHLGQYTKALDYYEQSLGISKKTGDLRGESTNLSNIGATYAQMGQYDEALKAANKSLLINEKMGVPVIDIKDSIANYYLDGGNTVKAEPLINETKGNSTLGRLALINSDYQSAQRYYENDMKWSEKTGDADALFRSYTGLARAHEGMEDYPKAEEYYERAMNHVEEIRSGLLPSERKNFFDVKVGGFARLEPAKGLSRIRIKLNHSEASIAPSELTKARSFADHLSQTNATGTTNIPSNLMKKEQSCVNQLAALKKELAKTDPDKAPERFENLSKSVKDAKDELNFFVDRLWIDYPAYAAVKYPRPPSLKDSALLREECAVIFDVSSEGVGVVLIRDKVVKKAFYLDIKLSDLERDVMRFREPFEKLRFKDYDPELAKSLYDKLLRPALVDVPKGAPVVIMPDGILAMLPFEALVTGGEAHWNKGAKGFDYPEGLAFLGDEHPISYYQSITALTLVRTMGDMNKQGGKLLVMADPVFEMRDARAQKATEMSMTEPERANALELMAAIVDSSNGSFKFKRLPQTGVLADRLSHIYGSKSLALTGLKATKSELLLKIAPQIDQYGSVVFATHGVMGNQVPGIMEAFLALTMVPPGTDGFLTMSDILSFKMNSDIVALTACQTGLGKDVSGEGVMSMGRSFQYAGAKSVLMTLWSVEEISALNLVESFFLHRMSGKSKLESLKLAREEIRKQGFEHPFFWAPFILVGEVY